MLDLKAAVGNMPIRTNGEMSIQFGTWRRIDWELIEDMEVSLKLKNI